MPRKNCPRKNSGPYRQKTGPRCSIVVSLWCGKRLFPRWDGPGRAGAVGNVWFPGKKYVLDAATSVVSSIQPPRVAFVFLFPVCFVLFRFVFISCGRHASHWPIGLARSNGNPDPDVFRRRGFGDFTRFNPPAPHAFPFVLFRFVFVFCGRHACLSFSSKPRYGVRTRNTQMRRRQIASM